jgi:hypothetical protein
LKDEVEAWIGIGDIKGCDGEDCVWRLKEIMRGVNSCAISVIYVIVMGFEL